jgi:hypothetical protein
LHAGFRPGRRYRATLVAFRCPRIPSHLFTTDARNGAAIRGDSFFSADSLTLVWRRNGAVFHGDFTEYPTLLTSQESEIFFVVIRDGNHARPNNCACQQSPRSLEPLGRRKSQDVCYIRFDKSMLQARILFCWYSGSILHPRISFL